jgi:hypothetical protein
MIHGTSHAVLLDPSSAICTLNTFYAQSSPFDIEAGTPDVEPAAAARAPHTIEPVPNIFIQIPQQVNKRHLLLKSAGSSSMERLFIFIYALKNQMAHLPSQIVGHFGFLEA